MILPGHHVRDVPILFQILELLAIVDQKRTTGHETHRCDSPEHFLATPKRPATYVIPGKSPFPPPNFFLYGHLFCQRAYMSGEPYAMPNYYIDLFLQSPIPYPHPLGLPSPSVLPEESNSVIYECELHLLQLDPRLSLSPMLTKNISLQAFQVSCLHGHDLH